jgi:hypothetical protein
VEFFAWLEAYGLAGCNGNFGAGARVATDARFARLDGEDAEAAELDAVACNEGLLHAVEDGVDSRFCLGTWKARSFHNPLYEVLLNHEDSPFLDASVWKA